MKIGIIQTYATCLRAYPEPFRQKYADEMSDVFSERVEETGRQGFGALLGLALSETWHTLGAIVRAYCASRRRPPGTRR